MIYEDGRECSSKFNEAFEAVSQVWMLLEFVLQTIVKKYSPNANLQFILDNENAHMEIVNDEDKDEESSRFHNMRKKIYQSRCFSSKTG
jgi:hypothetical protein